jgi:hypothetical protein
LLDRLAVGRGGGAGAFALARKPGWGKLAGGAGPWQRRMVAARQKKSRGPVTLSCRWGKAAPEGAEAPYSLESFL